MLFTITVPKCPNKGFFAPKLFMFNKTLGFETLQGAGLKYDISFLKFWLKNTQARFFWSQIWTFFVLHETAF